MGDKNVSYKRYSWKIGYFIQILYYGLLTVVSRHLQRRGILWVLMRIGTYDANSVRSVFFVSVSVEGVQFGVAQLSGHLDLSGLLKRVNVLGDGVPVRAG